MNRKINNLEELIQEKARVRAQLDIVQAELAASAKRTRLEFKSLVEDKLSLSKQLGQLFHNAGTSTTAGSTAMRAIGQVAGNSGWWGGIAATLLPLVVDFVRKQVDRWRQRRLAQPAGDPAKPKSRKLFKRKTPKTDPSELQG